MVVPCIVLEPVNAPLTFKASTVVVPAKLRSVKASTIAAPEPAPSE